MDINICPCYGGIRYVVQLKILVLPEGLQVTDGSVGSLPSWYHPKKVSYNPVCPAGSSVHQQWNTQDRGPGNAQDPL